MTIEFYVRNQAIVNLWASGNRVEEIAARFSVSRERVKQIVRQNASDNDQALRESLKREARVRKNLTKVEGRIKRSQPIHGANRYSHYGCRCYECRLAHNARMRREKKLGTLACVLCGGSGFTSHGLKCHIRAMHAEDQVG